MRLEGSCGRWGRGEGRALWVSERIRKRVFIEGEGECEREIEEER